MTAAALLEVAGLRKAFGRVVVADELTFSVARGEAVGIVGPNGAGKTSLLNLITGTLRADGGRIVLDGSPIERLPAHARARLGIGRTYQVPRPFSGMTVFENVVLGSLAAGGLRRRAADEAAVEALARSGLLDRANMLAGTLTLLDLKRLELARALAVRPRVLLLDEIAGGLTEAETTVLSAEIVALRAEGVTILWIEHVVHALLSVVDRLIATNFGRLLIDGEPRAVMASPSVQAVYLGEGVEA
jgi:branched-chain amino acid transport system ATP-binding protein